MSDGVSEQGNVSTILPSCLQVVQSTTVMSNVLTALVYDEQASECETSGKDSTELKAAGNAAFKDKQYKRAAAFYTSALLSCGEVSRALLANWSLCCLNSGANLDAVASAAASLRIRNEAKAIVRLSKGLLLLGEPELCQDVLQSGLAEVIEKGTDMFSERNELLESVACFADVINIDGLQGLAVLNQQKHLPRFVGAIETFNACSKGRGVRAKEDVKQGQVLLIEPPLASSAVDFKTDKRNDMLVSIDKSDVKDPSQAFLRQAIILRSQKDGVLSRIVDCLSDGKNKRPVTAVEGLIPSLESCKVLLPSHYEYMPSGEEKVELTADRVDAIVSVNSHGTGGEKEAHERYTGASSTCLLAATSMFNHAVSPTCDQLTVGGCHVVFAVANINAGEELTVKYHKNEDVVRRHWGITS